MTSSCVSTPPVPSGGTESSSITEFKVLQCRYTWTIQNFSDCQLKPGETLNSSTFSSETDDNIKWCLSLYPSGENEENKDDLSLFLILLSSYKTEIKVKYNFLCADENGIETSHVYARESTLLQKSDDDRPKCGSQLISKKFLMNKAHGLLPNDNLTIVCELSASTMITRRLEPENGTAAGPDRSQSTVVSATSEEQRESVASLSTSNSNVPVKHEGWGCTHLKTTDLLYKWKVKNFSFSQGMMGKSMRSPKFSFGTDNKLEWNLKLYPNGRKIKKRMFTQYVSIFLQNATINEFNVNAKFKIWLENSKRAEINKNETPEPQMFVKEKISTIGFYKFIKRAFLLDRANGLLEDDTLTICCEINYLTDIVSVTGESMPIPTEDRDN